MKPRLLLAMAFLLCAAARPAGAFTLSGFEEPECFVSDPEDGAYYVSNVAGALPDKPDGRGYVSKISPGGTIVIQRFIAGKPSGPRLNAPRGLAVVARTLFVADVDVIKGFDKKTRQYVALVDLSGQGARHLNDLAYDGARYLYASDLLANRIFRVDLKDHFKTTIFEDSPQLGNPNGLMINPKTKNLMVVTWLSGQILEIDHAGKIHTLKKGLSALGGLDYDGKGNLYVSNFEKGEVYRIPFYGRGPLSTYLSGLTGPADVSFDRRRGELLIASLKGNSVATYPQEPASSPEK